MDILRAGLNLYFFKKEPFSLIHFITNKCNAKCKHCFINFDDPKIREELTLKEIKRLTQNLGHSLFNVNLTGGEPFLRKDILEIVLLYFKNTSTKSIFISTNGMFTEAIKNFIDGFISAKVNSKIMFSISIDNFEIKHDSNRRVKGLFKNAIKTYKMVQSYDAPKIMPNIAITVTSHNYKDVVRLYKHLKKIGVRSVTATIWREEGVVKKIDTEIKRGILASYKQLSGLIQKDQFNGEMIGFGNHLHGLLMKSKNMIINEIVQKTYISPKFISLCPAASLFGVIYANGDVYPCEILSRKLGNLKEYKMNFMKLWANQRTQECKKLIRQTKCTCTFECAWSVNVLSNPKFLPSLLLRAAKVKK